MNSNGSKALFHSLASDIQALLDAAATNGQDSESWHDLADQLHVKLSSIYEPIYSRIPHELEHYLCDSDIRQKDEAYRRAQESEIMSYLPKWTTETVETEDKGAN